MLPQGREGGSKRTLRAELIAAALARPPLSGEGRLLSMVAALPNSLASPGAARPYSCGWPAAAAAAAAPPPVENGAAAQAVIGSGSTQGNRR